VISKHLEVALHNGFVRAREKHQRWITVEHLLLQLVDEPSIQEWLESSGVDITGLRTELARYVSKAEAFPSEQYGDTEPTAAFQRTIQYAILRAQESSAAEVTAVHIFETVVAESKRISLDPVVQRHLSAFKRGEREA
jgi:ATP-dependent Clp protease ATP-binding subunit ClpA